MPRFLMAQPLMVPSSMVPFSMLRFPLLRSPRVCSPLPPCALGPGLGRTGSGVLRGAALAGLGFGALLVAAPVGAAEPQVQLSCSGTLLQARGSAELKRPVRALRVSLALEAEAATAAAALAELQSRLAAVRQRLQQLGVAELEVSSPSTWRRPASRERPAAELATLRLQGRLQPERLQPLVREVGALPGVRLAPVQAEADPAADAASRRQLLARAYGDALSQARDLAAAIGLRQLRPLQVQADDVLRPQLLRGMAADAAPAPFDPAELPPPTDRLSLAVSFCAS